MRSASMIVLFTWVTQAAAELKVGSVQPAELDNTTLTMLTFRVPGGIRIPQSRLSPPLRFPLPQGRRDFSHQWSTSWDHGASANLGAHVQVMQAATRGAPAAMAAELEAAAPVGGRLNVFGEKLQGCQNEGDLCAFSEESPDLCIRTGKFEPFRLECKSIWNAEWKSFKLPGFKVKESQKAAVGDTTKCDAVPAEVLDSQYSKDEWSSADGSSTNPNKSGVPKYNALGLKQSTSTSPKGKRFRKSIDFICETCAVYAEGEGAKNALLSKCEAVGWKSTLKTETSNAETQMFALTSSSIICNVTIALIGLFAGSGVTVMALFSRRCGGVAATKY